MKATLLHFVLLFSLMQGFAQPVINNLYNFQPGDSYTYRKLAAGQTIDYNSIVSTGANISWDMTYLQLAEGTFTDTIIPYASSSWPSSFPGCDYVWKEYSGTEQYYRKNGDSLLYMGNAIWAPSYFSPNPPTLVYPATYSPSGYLYSGFQCYLNNFALWTFEARYNAYGTLELPGNVAVPNCALYVSYGGPENTGYSDFMWVREGESLPIMRIQFVHSESNIAVQYCYILYSALTRVKDERIPEDIVSVFPNPVRDFINISSKQSLVLIELTDIQGRTLVSAAYPGKECKLDASVLEKGVYLVRFRDDLGRTGVRRILR
jgi:hypothetical protein